MWLVVCGCSTTSYDCRAPSYPFGLAAEPIVFRVIRDRAVPDHDDTVAIFTHPEQYDGDAKNVDFEHEEIVRITARIGAGAQVASVVRSHALVGLVVDATHSAPGIATHEIDVVIPLTPIVPELWVHRP
jgi:hypothetical protein